MSVEEKDTDKATTKETAKQAAKKVSVKTVEKEKVAYIGPSILHVIATGTVLTNGLPEKLKKKVEERPEIGSLIVPVESLAEAMKELKKTGSALSIIYKKLEEE